MIIWNDVHRLVWVTCIGTVLCFPVHSLTSSNLLETWFEHVQDVAYVGWMFSADLCYVTCCWENAAMFGCSAGDRSSKPLQSSHQLVHLMSELCMFDETDKLYCASSAFSQHRQSECQL